MIKHIDVTEDIEGVSRSRWRVYQRANDFGIYDPSGNYRATVQRSPSCDCTRQIKLAQRIADLMKTERW